MAYENLFNGRLVLFANNEKRSEKSPDMSGSIEFDLSNALALAEWITAQPGEENYAGDKKGKLRNQETWPDISCLRNFGERPREAGPGAS